MTAWFNEPVAGAESEWCKPSELCESCEPSETEVGCGIGDICGSCVIGSTSDSCGVCDAIAVGAAPSAVGIAPPAVGAAPPPVVAAPVAETASAVTDVGGRPHLVLLVLKEEGVVRLGIVIGLRLAERMVVSMMKLVGVVSAAAGGGVLVTISFL